MLHRACPLLFSLLLFVACKPPNGPQPVDEYDRANRLPPLEQAEAKLMESASRNRDMDADADAEPEGLANAGPSAASGLSSATDDAGQPTISPMVGEQPLTGTVLETMDVSQYTYMLVDTGTGKHWAAAAKMPLKVGDHVSLSGYMRMTNVKSPELKRSFDEILFVMNAAVVDPDAGKAASADAQTASKAPVNPHAQMNASAINPHAADPHAGLAGHGGDPHAGLGLGDKRGEVTVKVEKLPDGRTVSELFAEKKSLAGSAVRLRGQVVKVNNGILGRNWLHLRDGSGVEGTNDITVTSDQTARVGDVVIVEGTLHVDKDLGSGYFFPVIVEEAIVTNDAGKSAQGSSASPQ